MISCVFSRHNSPIVIERPLNRIEFDDLLMEYNTEEGPTANVSVSVIITLNSARIYDDILRTSITMEQIWRDMRLSFKGVSEVPLPNSVRIWQPDTVILNALSYDTKMTSLFLNFDGTIRKKQLLFVEVLCDESPNVTMKSDILECSLELTSFSNRGCEQITYSVEKINNDRIAQLRGRRLNAFLNLTKAEEKDVFRVNAIEDNLIDMIL
ncbi:hypothetical protein DICVIV_01449 [Dictyocaulus viviparus]|uniref:Neurotransmitter-gated ion-channel ligand-binding domain-containing protein n=1 Tax=Dictyocaulus viviparus TaxID=29172 RepID=A0A0D8Y840_DICVI|nr:hypothetical protein DICVIV_01449 [Dictyocaulus viviparus]